MTPFPPHVRARAAELAATLPPLAEALAAFDAARDRLRVSLPDEPFQLRPAELAVSAATLCDGIRDGILAGGVGAERAADRIALLAGHLVPNEGEPASADPTHGSNRATVPAPTP